jgi:putative nucleotidyltransferase with HDIG domain
MPIALRIYIYTVIALGITALAFFLPQVQFILIIICLGIIAGIFEKYSVELPNGTFFTGAIAFPLITMVFYGIPEAITVEISSIIFCFIFAKDKGQIIQNLFNLSQYTFCILLAGITYSLLGGTLGTFNLEDIPRLLIAIAIYNILNLILLSVVMSILRQKDYISTFIEMVQDVIFVYVVTSLLSIRLALIFDPQDQSQFWIEIFFILILFLALRYAFSLFINLRKTYLTSMESLTHLTELKLSISEGHSTRVGRIARKVAEELKLSQAEIDAIHYAALLHDTGKSQLEEQMFQKRGPLTLEEEKEYRNHVEIGAAMVKEIVGLGKASEYVRYHHEQWDGKGFPEGKKGEDIPLGARIIAVANEYDHMINDEKVKKPDSEFKHLAFHKLDPQLVEIVIGFADFKIDGQGASSEVAIEDKLIEKIVISKARNKFYQSKLLENFGASLIVTYDERFRDEQGKEITVPCEDEILFLIKKARNQKSRVREFIEDPKTGKVFDIYCVPIEQQVKVMFFDVSHLLDYEKKQEERVKSMYRDIIFSVTQGRLLLADDLEINSFYESDLVAEATIKSKADVAHCREQVQKVLEALVIPDKLKFNLLLCTSEATTNVLKHSTEGQMKVFRHKDALRVIVKDNGSGIELSDIPKSTLLSGYSTKMSMGKGFSLLLKLMDRVIINTGPNGTTVVLEMKLELEEEC